MFLFAKLQKKIKTNINIDNKKISCNDSGIRLDYVFILLFPQEQ